MKIKSVLIVAIPSVFLTSFVIAQDCDDPTGTWISQSGAKLDIQEINPVTGQLTGNFKSPDSLFQDGPHTGTGYAGNTRQQMASNGFPATASTLSFTVKWPDESISSWNGYCDVKDEVPTITSLWLWVRPNVNKYIERNYSAPFI